jgi:hypothetical protein
MLGNLFLVTFKKYLWVSKCHKSNTFNYLKPRELKAWKPWGEADSVAGKFNSSGIKVVYFTKREKRIVTTVGCQDFSIIYACT